MKSASVSCRIQICNDQNAKQALFLCTLFFYQKANVRLFSDSLMRRYEYSRGLSKLWSVPGVLVSFLELHFLGKMALLALGGRPQPLKNPSQSQKGHFYKRTNALNDTKTSELSKSAEGNICDRLWHLSKRGQGTLSLSNNPSFKVKRDIFTRNLMH